MRTEAESAGLWATAVGAIAAATNSETMAALKMADMAVLLG
jgi:hypothetical protein